MSDTLLAQPVASPTLAITVSYNGLPKPFSASPSSTVNALLQHALREFQIADRPHTFALFNEAGQELPDASTLHDAGVKDQAVLLLRPSTVKGGHR
jgi:uncharacterized protein DUF2604